jgi:hypothetical protein
LLSIEIDGRGTVMTCNKMGVMFSWQGQSSLGGYIGDDFQAFFSSVVSGAAGTYLTTLRMDAGISTDLTIEPGQAVVVSGDREKLGVAPRWGSGGFTVRQFGSLALTYVGLGDSTITLRSGGSLRLSSMAVPAAVLRAVEGQLSGAGSRLRLSAVTLLEVPDAEELAGTMTVGANGTKTVDPPGFGASPIFAVSSGRACTNVDKNYALRPTTYGTCLEWDDTPPCEVSEGGRCVGRPNGYNPLEECTIAVGGGAGLLGSCAVFDMDWTDDPLTLPDGSKHTGSDCPAGAALLPGDALSWASNYQSQGTVGGCIAKDGCMDGCISKGTCGLPYSELGLGGGWVVCFA